MLFWRSASVLLLVAATGVAQERRRPPVYRRIVSPEARHYVVSWQVDRTLSFEFRERREGAGPLADVSRQWARKPVEEGDRLIDAGVVDHPVAVGAVLDRDAAFLAFGSLHDWERPVFCVEASGRVRWRRTVADLLDEEVRERILDAAHWHSGFVWRYSAWVVEPLGIVVLVIDEEVRTIDLASGAVAVAEPTALFDCARHGVVAARHDAIDHCEQWRPEGVAASMRALAADEHQPTAIRGHAAVVAWRVEPSFEAGPFVRAALDEGTDNPLVLEDAFAILGEEAVRGLARSLRAGHDRAWEWIAKAGEPAVPALVAILDDASEDRSVRRNAVRALHTIASPRALPALVRAAQGGEGDIAGAAVRACLRVGGPEAAAALLPLLEGGSPHSDDIVRLVTEHPTPDAVPPLLAELARTGPSSGWRWQVMDALRACSGRDLGNDPQVWLRELR